jgi:hypothetical protein
LQIGPLTTDDAIPLDVPPESARQRLLPIETAVSELPRLTLDAASARKLFQGQYLASPANLEPGEAAAFDDAGRLLMILEVRDGTLHAKKALVSL